MLHAPSIVVEHFTMRRSKISWASSSVARAPGLHPGGRGFDSHLVHMIYVSRYQNER